MINTYADVINFLNRIHGTLEFMESTKDTSRFQMRARNHTIDRVWTHKEQAYVQFDIVEQELVMAARRLGLRIGS